MNDFMLSRDVPPVTYCVLVEFETPEAERCMACHRCPIHCCLRAAVSAAYTHNMGEMARPATLSTD